MTLSLLLVLAVVFLALSNGANDNFKGVASLFGSRTVGYRVALAWATVTTAAGSLAAIALAEALLKRFSGRHPADCGAAVGARLPGYPALTRDPAPAFPSRRRAAGPDSWHT